MIIIKYGYGLNNFKISVIHNSHKHLIRINYAYQSSSLYTSAAFKSVSRIKTLLINTYTVYKIQNSEQQQQQLHHHRHSQ